MNRFFLHQFTQKYKLEQWWKRKRGPLDETALL
jgi:hypothetical protein